MPHIIEPSELLTSLGLDDSITDDEQVVVAQCHREAESAVVSHLGYHPRRFQRTEIYPQQFPAKMPQGAGMLEPNEAGTRASLTFEGPGFGELQLTGIPIRTLTSVFVDEDANFGNKSGAFGAASAKTVGEEVYPRNDVADDDGNLVCTDGILLAEFGWPSSPGTIKVVYTAGFTAEELHGQSDQLNAGGIMRAIIDAATQRLHQKIRFQRKGRVGIFAPGALVSEKMGDYAYQIKDSDATDDLTAMATDLPDSAVLALEEWVNWGVQLT